MKWIAFMKSIQIARPLDRSILLKNKAPRRALKYPDNWLNLKGVLNHFRSMSVKKNEFAVVNSG